MNLVYDPNPAIRLGLEYSWYESHYANNQYNVYGNAATVAPFATTGTGGLSNNGTVNTLRFSAQYFF